MSPSGGEIPVGNCVDVECNKYIRECCDINHCNHRQIFHSDKTCIKRVSNHSALIPTSYKRQVFIIGFPNKMFQDKTQNKRDTKNHKHHANIKYRFFPQDRCCKSMKDCNRKLYVYNNLFYPIHAVCTDIIGFSANHP